MTDISYVAVLFVALLPLCFGNADSYSKALLNRIEALERRDLEQSARIKLLEEQLLVANDKLQHMSTYIEDLQKENAGNGKKQEEQNNIIAALLKDLEHQKSTADKSRLKINSLSDRLKEMDSRIKKMDKTVSDMKDNYTEQPNEVRATTTRENKIRQFIDQRTDNKHREKSISSLSESSSREADQSSKETIKLGTTEIHDIKSDTKDNYVNLATGDAFHTSVNSQMKTKRNVRRQLKLTRSVADTDAVAFHAVYSQAATHKLGLNEEIKFDDVLLNQGNGYHVHHGLFIAPKEGVYLFSSTIYCSTKNSTFNEVQATIRKNGVQLARIVSQSAVGTKMNAQGSVTVVTYMNVGDEVWVSFDWPDGGIIWGNGFTSFSGILVK